MTETAAQPSPVGLVRAAHSALVKGDDAALRRLLSEDAVWHTTEDDGQVRTYRGQEAVVEALLAEARRWRIEIRSTESAEEAEVSGFAFQPALGSSLVQVNHGCEQTGLGQSMVAVNQNKITEFGTIRPRLS